MTEYSRNMPEQIPVSDFFYWMQEKGKLLRIGSQSDLETEGWVFEDMEGENVKLKRPNAVEGEGFALSGEHITISVNDLWEANKEDYLRSKE